MKKNVPEVSYDELQKLLSYNKHTGLLTWRVTRSRLAKQGDPAGTPAHTGTIMVGLQGRTYTAPRLIWFYVMGVWPLGKVRQRDNDPNNLRWNNFVEENANLSRKHAAVYQRRRRKILKIAKKIIADDPSLSRAYMDPANAGERRILSTIAAQVEDDMLRNGIDPAARPASKPQRQRVSRVKHTTASFTDTDNAD